MTILSLIDGHAQESEKQKNFEFVPAPYLDYSRSLGFGYGLIPLGMYRISPTDTISPKSISGLVAGATTNDSRFFMGFTRLFLSEDKWRITAAAGTGNIHFQVYLESSW